MKIAVPTNDGVTISEHFGRSAAFLVFQAENGQIISQELRQNIGQHSHEQSVCGSHAEHAGAQDHSAILSALAGCDVVICAGMGRRAVDALQQAGIREVILTEPGPVEAPIQAYLKGQLVSRTQGFCRCSHQE